MLKLLLILPLALLAFAGCRYLDRIRSKDVRAKIDFNNPVRSAVDDEITALPGLNEAIDFRQYSGYLNASPDGNKFHHYWFVESSHDPINSPIVLWLNGGPGCSSVGGLLSELGPFEVNQDGKTLKRRKYTWNKVANVLFMESPVGVGYSYSKNEPIMMDDDSTALDNYLSLKSFFKKFPQYKNNPLYLSGESYAGVYLPTLAVHVDKDPEMNLKGIAIGNGYLDAKKLGTALIFFSYHHGFAGKSSWDAMSRYCCNSKPPSRENCDFQGENCNQAIDRVMVGMDRLNMYNIYADCATSGRSNGANGLSHDQVHRNLILQQLEQIMSPTNLTRFGESLADKLGVSVPCVDSHLLSEYMNLAAVRTALHVPSDLPTWDLCAEISYNKIYPWQEGGLTPFVKALMESKRKLKIIVYNGDVDSVCNFLGDEWFVDDLGRKVIKDYAPWKVGNQIAGYVKHYDGIAFVTVRGSGHMVPQDKPEEALAMFERFLGGCNGTMFEL